MKHLTRRKFLITLASVSAASLGEPLWRPSVFAAMDAKLKTAPVSAPLAAPTEFTNRLRLPGASGFYAPVAAKDVKQITVSELNLEVLPKLASPLWAYVAKAGGKQLLNPTLLARPGDEIKLRMVNRLKQPTIIHWHEITNDERNDGKGNWTINGWRFNMKETPVTVRRGTRETWLLQNNRASMPHPMHIHGFQFRVLERQNSPAQVKALATRHFVTSCSRASRTRSCAGPRVKQHSSARSWRKSWRTTRAMCSTSDAARGRSSSQLRRPCLMRLLRAA